MRRLLWPTPGTRTRRQRKGQPRLSARRLPASNVLSPRAAEAGSANRKITDSKKVGTERSRRFLLAGTVRLSSVVQRTQKCDQQHH
jgi:hypothetical protein